MGWNHPHVMTFHVTDVIGSKDPPINTLLGITVPMTPELVLYSSYSILSHEYYILPAACNATTYSLHVAVPYTTRGPCNA